jgi:hypothetical protein
MSGIAQERPTGRARTRLVVLIGACATIAACGGSGPSHRLSALYGREAGPGFGFRGRRTGRRGAC